MREPPLLLKVQPVGTKSLTRNLYPSPPTGLIAAPYLGIELPNPFSTPGVKNIEKRYSSGGGSPNHTPAMASKRGDANQVMGNTEKTKGIGSQHWEEHMGGQKPEVCFSLPPFESRFYKCLVHGPSCLEAQASRQYLHILGRGRGIFGHEKLLTWERESQGSTFDKTWNKTHYGAEKGK